MTTQDFAFKSRQLIDSLKAVCAAYGLGNDGNEFKIITQVFLYKFLNDKFAFEAKRIRPELQKSANWEADITAMDGEEFEMLQLQVGADTALLKPEHFLANLFQRQKEGDFARLFDDTLQDIAITNTDIFSVKTGGGAKVLLFDRVSEFITDTTRRDDFCCALINKLVDFSFEHIFFQKFDFFADLFQYLINDYNKDGGGKYAEYYTPHAVAKIMAAILVPEAVRGKVNNVICYDPSAGSGTLLMNLAHAIGENCCTIYSQDISQKSSSLLRLNLILNNLVHSIPNIIQGDTLLAPYHRNGKELQKFDYIVSNPPFKMDFSDDRENMNAKEHRQRFFAGVPKVPKKAKEKMAIYQLFLQHIIFSLKRGGKAAVVVPTGFITAQSGIDKKIREHLVDKKLLAGVVSMPSNIFATTGTNVSIVFIDAGNMEDVVLIDASSLGNKVKDGKNQKTLLSAEEEDRIIATFNAKEVVADFSVVVGYKDISEKNYSFNAGQYFDMKIEHIDITSAQFIAKMQDFQKRLDTLFAESRQLEEEIKKQLGRVQYE